MILALIAVICTTCYTLVCVRAYRLHHPPRSHNPKLAWAIDFHHLLK